MQGKHWLVVISVLGLALSGCEWKQANPDYCPPEGACLMPGMGESCCGDNECHEEGRRVCTVNISKKTCNSSTEGECVQCTTDALDACTGLTPACGADNLCRGCQAHDECSNSAACLPDGSCADLTEVAYVNPNGTDNDDCNLGMPCTKMAKALTTGRRYVKLTGTIIEDAAVTLMDRSVTLLAEPNAKLTRLTAGSIMDVKGSSQVTIYDLEISGTLGGGHGISMMGGNTSVTLERVKLLGNSGSGVFADGGTLTISRSTVSGNLGNKGGISVENNGRLTISRSRIMSNPGGGISVTTGGTFVVIGNVFLSNGLTSGSIGGISIMTMQNAVNRLEFNSFTGNLTQAGAGAAIHCLAGIFTARNNIMSNNGTLASPEQVGGACAHAYSIVRPGQVPVGMENSNMDPLFMSEITGDLHLRAGSPALGAADPNSDLSGLARFDIDGNERRLRADMGAYEVP